MRLGIDTSVLIASIKRKGERFHGSCLRLAELVRSKEHEAVSSALVLIEFPGGLASSTRIPIEMIYTAEASVQQCFGLEIASYEEHVDRAIDLMFELRDLKRKLGIESADFHHLATAIGEGCHAFVTTDERHLLREEARDALRRYLKVLDPSEAAHELGRT